MCGWVGLGVGKSGSGLMAVSGTIQSGLVGSLVVGTFVLTTSTLVVLGIVISVTIGYTISASIEYSFARILNHKLWLSWPNLKLS